MQDTTPTDDTGAAKKTNTCTLIQLVTTKRKDEKVFEPENQAMNSSSSSEQASTMERPVASASDAATTNDAVVAELQSTLSMARIRCATALSCYKDCALAFVKNINAETSVPASEWHRPFEEGGVEFPLPSRRLLVMHGFLKSLEDDFWVARLEMALAQRRFDDFNTPRRVSEQESTVTDTMDVDDSHRNETRKTKKPKTKR